MKTEELLNGYLRNDWKPEPLSWELLLELLESWAAHQDNRINHRLLKDLILKYSMAGRRLAALNQQKNKFLGIAAHDLRNPLISIRGFSELLLTEDPGPLTAEQKEFVTIIHDVSEGMLNLVNNLLDIAVIESGKLYLQIHPGSLRDLLEARIKVYKRMAEKKSITLHFTSTEVPEAHFDPQRISQVIDNLVSNAIKFSPPGSDVHVKQSQDGDHLKVLVMDEGPGISSEDKEKLFHAFQKLSPRPTGGEQSVGLGLAIVKKIVDAHQGSLEVKSIIGVGSTFSFKIPIGGPK